MPEQTRPRARGTKQMNPQTPDNEVEVSSKQTMLTAQSDSVELYHALCDRSADFSKALDACRDYRKQLDEKTNEVARLRKLMREYIDFIDANMGTTADWPMEAAFDNEATAQRHCDLLNAMKREVKPEDIN